jgi:hypothetical protein
MITFIIVNLSIIQISYQYCHDTCGITTPDSHIDPPDQICKRFVGSIRSKFSRTPNHLFRFGQFAMEQLLRDSSMHTGVEEPSFAKFTMMLNERKTQSELKSYINDVVNNNRTIDESHENGRTICSLTVSQVIRYNNMVVSSLKGYFKLNDVKSTTHCEGGWVVQRYIGVDENINLINKMIYELGKNRVFILGVASHCGRPYKNVSHYLLIFKHIREGMDHKFLFWDSDATSSRYTNYGRSIGYLSVRNQLLTTSYNDDDDVKIYSHGYYKTGCTSRCRYIGLSLVGMDVNGFQPQLLIKPLA